MSEILFVERIVLRQELFEFSFIHARENALTFVNIADSFRETDGRTDRKSQSHTEIAFNPIIHR